MAGQALLIAAQSGRALAAAARRAGYQPYVADFFGDEDTRALSAGFHQVRGRLGRGPRGDMLRALGELAAEAGPRLAGVVLGSGFEGAPDLVEAIARRHRLLGAPAECVRALKDPLRFDALCTRLAIPHPPVSLEPMAEAQGWLWKRRGGSGGGHIRPARPGPLPRGFYRQRRVPGEPRSLAFLADGRGMELVGVTEQWSMPRARAPFRYGGAAGPADLPPAVLAGAARAVAAVVAATGLVGLASADLLVDGERWWLVEINPRPGATLYLLDRGAVPLLQRHLAACAGQLIPGPPGPGAAGGAILYAERSLQVGCPEWPPFVHDRPRRGSHVEAGAPLCTVTASGDSVRAVRALLMTRTSQVSALLMRGAKSAVSPESGARNLRDMPSHA